MRLMKRIFICLFTIVLTVTVTGIFCIFYAFKIEPYRLSVNEYVLNNKHENAEEIKIVQFSDLHVKEDFSYRNQEKVVEKINAQNPDIVIFTGDLYDNYARYHDDENIIKQLSDINARYEKIAVWGNRDYGGGAVRQYEFIMQQSGFTLLKNENWYVTTENGEKILFTGLDDSILGQPYMPDSTKIYDWDYQMLLTHEPDAADEYLAYQYNMVLSGHSHGGQIRIPLMPAINEAALSATSLAARYSGGLYELNSDGSSKLYVNTGIGTTHISARFCVVPEIAVFYLYL